MPALLDLALRPAWSFLKEPANALTTPRRVFKGTMKTRIRSRALVLFLAISMLLGSGAASAAAADASKKPVLDLAISKVFAQCRDLLPSKKVACIKAEAKELVGDAVEECTAKSLGQRVPCLADRLKEEAGKVEGVIWALHLLYQGMHGREPDNSVLGNMYQMARIKTDPLVLLEDKELLAGLKKDLWQEISEMKGTDGNGNCRKDASLIGMLNCLRAEYLPQATAKEILTWVAYAKIYAVYAADKNEVNKQLIALQADLAQAAKDPKRLQDPQYRKQLTESAKDIRRRAEANAKFWRSYNKELLGGLDHIIIASKAAGAAVGRTDSDSVIGSSEWNETFKKLDEGFALGSDWDKTFGPGGSMDQMITDMDRLNRDLDRTNQELDQTNRELEQTGRELKKLNQSLDQMNRDLAQMNRSIDADMKSIDGHMAKLREDVAEMDRIGNRKHPELWDNLYKDLDLSGVGDYVRGGPKVAPDPVQQVVQSGLLDMTPVAGDFKGVHEAIYGEDLVTGQELSVPERLMGSIVVLRWMKAGKKFIDPGELADVMKAEKTTGKIDGWLSKEAWNKVPDHLQGYEKVNRKGAGYRWNDGKGNGVRIDKGNPDNPQVYQQVDHVVINSGGKIIGRNGQPIKGSIENDPREAHIPLDEWLKWNEWNKP
ncbi:pre-toxin TG domain-containing protein [Streptomyces rimosus]|nr:pre-toxin TG domain-containing protein [Streptomyces rimosus]